MVVSKDQLQRQCLRLVDEFDNVQRGALEHGVHLKTTPEILSFARLFGASPSPKDPAPPVRESAPTKKPPSSVKTPPPSITSLMSEVRWRRVKEGQARAKEGRQAVARGDRPPLIDAITRVMGDQDMDSSAIVAALKKRGWMPNTDKPQQYISFTLCSNKKAFKRLARGLYTVRKPTFVPTAKEKEERAQKILEVLERPQFTGGVVQATGMTRAVALRVLRALKEKGAVKTRTRKVANRKLCQWVRI